MADELYIRTHVVMYSLDGVIDCSEGKLFK